MKITNGTQLNPVNNQPVIKDQIIGVHNGIIVNVDDLWQKYPNLDRQYEIDTEVLFTIIQNNYFKNNSYLERAISDAINDVYAIIIIWLIV